MKKLVTRVEIDTLMLDMRILAMLRMPRELSKMCADALSAAIMNGVASTPNAIEKELLHVCGITITRIEEGSTKEETKDNVVPFSAPSAQSKNDRKE